MKHDPQASDAERPLLRREHGEVGGWVGAELDRVRREVTRMRWLVVSACLGFGTALSVGERQGRDAEVLLLGVALMATLAVIETWQHVRPRWWSQARCRILYTKAWDGVSIRSHRSARYSPIVVFEFEVDGARHRGFRVEPTLAGMERADAQRIVDRYEVGSMMTCYFSPRDPSNNVLTRGSPQWTLGLSVLATLLLFLTWLVS